MIFASFRDFQLERDRPTNQTDQPTDQRTDKASYRDAWTHLKITPKNKSEGKHQRNFLLILRGVSWGKKIKKNARLKIKVETKETKEKNRETFHTISSYFLPPRQKEFDLMDSGKN